MMQHRDNASTHSRTEYWQLQRRRNQRLGWIMASIAAAFFLGFLAKMVLLGR